MVGFISAFLVYLVILSASGLIAQYWRARTATGAQRARQALVEAQLGATLAARNLQNASGLAPTDRIVQLDGQPLVDPAEIAYTMLSLGSSFEVCAARDGGRYCRIVSLGDG